MKKPFLLLTFLIAGFTAAAKAQAICPICTIAVAAGVGLSRWLGIDDTITGLWIGGLTVSLIGWTINWMRSKHWRFRGDKLVAAVGYYALIIVPLYYSGMIGHPANKLWGVDKLLFGAIVGSVTFFLGALWYEQLKAGNNNRAHFPFQKVAMPVSPLIILSLIFYFLTK